MVDYVDTSEEESLLIATSNDELKKNKFIYKASLYLSNTNLDRLFLISSLLTDLKIDFPFNSVAKIFPSKAFVISEKTAFSTHGK